MPTASAQTDKHHFRFDQHLTKDGMDAFRQLENDYHCEQLGGLLIFLAVAEVETDRGTRLPLRAFDRFEDAFRGTGKTEIRDLYSTVRKVKSVLNEIEKLTRTPFIKRLKRAGAFQERDFLLSLRPVEETLAPYFEGLLSLPQLAKEHLIKKRPDFDRRLKAACNHIHERTGQWHDNLLARVLCDLPIPDPCPRNADALLKWRNRHGLKG